MLLLQIDAPISRSIAHHVQRPAGSAFVDFVEQVVATSNQALENVPPIACCTSAGATPNLRTTATWRSDILPALQQAKVGGLSCRLPIRVTRTSSAASRRIRSTTIRFWSLASSTA